MLKDNDSKLQLYENKIKYSRYTTELPFPACNSDLLPCHDLLLIPIDQSRLVLHQASNIKHSKCVGRLWFEQILFISSNITGLGFLLIAAGPRKYIPISAEKSRGARLNCGSKTGAQNQELLVLGYNYALPVTGG